jgi:hypothetical protein
VIVADLAAGERWFAVAFSLVTIGAVLAPIVYDEDDFPLSNYPMFSHAREPVARIHHVVGYSSEGRHRPVPPEALGTDEIMQAYQTAKLMIGRGPDAARALCERTAAYVAAEDSLADLERLEVRIDWFDTIAYWKGDRTPKKTHVAATCPTGRGAPG